MNKFRFPAARCLFFSQVAATLYATASLPFTNMPPGPFKRPASPLIIQEVNVDSNKLQADPHRPEQVHITLAGAGAVAISWVTHPMGDPAFASLLNAIQANTTQAEVDAWYADTAANKHHKHKHKHHKSRDPCRHLMRAPLTAQVKYGLQAGNYDTNINGTFTCYWSYEYTSGALHHVVVGAGEEGPLLPDTQYYYRVGDPERSWSREFSFTTPKPSRDNPYPLRVAVIGDLGQTDDSAATLEHAESNNPDFVLNVGDLSYADGFQPRWDSYGQLVERSAATTPWMVLEGNHERETINGEKSFISYLSRYYIPNQESGSDDPLYYSFELGPVHFLMLGSYAPNDRDSLQYQWLLEDLRGIDRARTPWVVVAMHCPFYNSNTAHYGEGDIMQDAMEDALFEHGVDMVFAGHVHAYERFHRVYKNERNECGPVHITIGDGGNYEGLDTVYLKQPKYSAYREPTFGHGFLEFLNSTHATWTWHRNTDKQKVVGDSLFIERVETCYQYNSAEQAQDAQPAAHMGIEVDAAGGLAAAAAQAGPIATGDNKQAAGVQSAAAVSQAR